MPGTTERSPAEEANVIVQELLDRMGLSVLATVADESDEQIIVDMAGTDVGIVIGHHGETLSAMQLLASVMLHRRAETNARLLLDAEGYRDRRANALTEQAKRHAASVKATGREALFEGLRPHERRIVHMALQDDPDVYTYSEGEGDDRVLVISPRD
jgi:spoIIIJ-associated protein